MLCAIFCWNLMQRIIPISFISFCATLKHWDSITSIHIPTAYKSTCIERWDVKFVVFHDFLHLILKHRRAVSYRTWSLFPSTEDDRAFSCHSIILKSLLYIQNIPLHYFLYPLLDMSNFFHVKTAEEHLAELMPIFEQLRAQGDLPCTYPLHVSSSAFGTAFIRGGSRSTPLSPHAPHCHPSSHWVSFLPLLLSSEINDLCLNNIDVTCWVMIGVHIVLC